MRALSVSFLVQMRQISLLQNSLSGLASALCNLVPSQPLSM